MPSAPRVVGVTGTDGKSTTTHLVESVLHADGRVVAAVSTVATSRDGRRVASTSRLTTPEADDTRRLVGELAAEGCEWLVLETSSHGLALGRVDEVAFDVGVVTNVTHEHLDFHGSPAAYRRAKALLLDKVASGGGTAVVNVDDRGAASLLEGRAGLRVIRCGVEEPADVSATAIEEAAWSTRFVLRAPGLETTVTLPVPGRFNVLNALCAAGAGIAAGVGADAVRAGLESFVPLPGRMQPVDAGQPFAVLVDFAHTPSALTAALHHARARHTAGRLAVVLGSAGQRDVLKRPWMGHIAATLADLVVLTVEDPREEDPGSPIEQLAAGAVAAGAHRGEDLECLVDRRAAIELALAWAEPGDCVLLAGKGHERSITWADHAQPWDEAEVARLVLAELGWPGPGGATP
jgi:UDP-N-acetylmuramyl-tripeptide synthetase